jgi:8-oxo-dGTP pyrophosphatase MutT (NUDIX family)
MSSRKPAYGGVVFDKAGRVLLREPTGHFDGYVWTFPKGRPDHGETPEDAALRETREETGEQAEIVDRIPGLFPGGVTDTVYFLMRPTGEPAAPPSETAAVQWATPEEANALIRQTTNQTGRNRDLAVLRAALELNRFLP